MIVLTQVIHDTKTNSLEATWVERTIAPDTVVPESTSEIEDDGGTVGLVVTPAQTIPGTVIDVQVKCHSYADVQMDLFRADAAKLGTSLDEHEDLIEQIEAAIVPYVAPPPPPVTEVSMAQARKALILSGFNLADVEPVFLSLPQPAQALARVDWEFAANVHRDNPLVAAVQASKGWTDNQVDALFSLAATL